ncbi:hypothetical protein F4802DRAFT_592087 [Xylaria palmicola]|nr:hypothetical protein F4802DRAFT_592087 [Xylaria palmicola]
MSSCTGFRISFAATRATTCGIGWETATFPPSMSSWPRDPRLSIFYCLNPPRAQHLPSPTSNYPPARIESDRPRRAPTPVPCAVPQPQPDNGRLITPSQIAGLQDSLLISPLPAVPQPQPHPDYGRVITPRQIAGLQESLLNSSLPAVPQPFLWADHHTGQGSVSNIESRHQTRDYYHESLPAIWNPAPVDYPPETPCPIKRDPVDDEVEEESSTIRNPPSPTSYHPVEPSMIKSEPVDDDEESSATLTNLSTAPNYTRELSSMTLGREDSPPSYRPAEPLMIWSEPVEEESSGSLTNPSAAINYTHGSSPMTLRMEHGLPRFDYESYSALLSRSRSNHHAREAYRFEGQIRSAKRRREDDDQSPPGDSRPRKIAKYDA